jgi:hypothetical protein
MTPTTNTIDRELTEAKVDLPNELRMRSWSASSAAALRGRSMCPPRYSSPRLAAAPRFNEMEPA